MVKFLMLLMLVFCHRTSAAAQLPQSIFRALYNPKKTIDLSSQPLKRALFIAHDCSACHRLLKKLKKSCKRLDNVTVFAVGNTKNLKSKLRLLKKLKADSKVFTGSTTEAYSNIGIDLMPYFISSKGKKFETHVFDGLVKDGVCVK